MREGPVTAHPIGPRTGPDLRRNLSRRSSPTLPTRSRIVVDRPAAGMPTASPSTRTMSDRRQSGLKPTTPPRSIGPGGQASRATPRARPSSRRSRDPRHVREDAVGMIEKSTTSGSNPPPVGRARENRQRFSAPGRADRLATTSRRGGVRRRDRAERGSLEAASPQHRPEAAEPPGTSRPFGYATRM